MSAKNIRLSPSQRVERPSYPTQSREWLGVLAILALIVALDRFSTLVFNVTSVAGLIYIVAIVYVACWSGLRSALAGCLLLLIYVWLAYHYPFSVVGRQTEKTTAAIVSTAIIFPIFAIVAGVVQNKLREAGQREADARAAASLESEQRKIVEAELWASEEMRRLIVDSSVDAVIGVSQGGEITMWNPNAEKLFGWTMAEAIGTLFSDLVRFVGSGQSTKTKLRMLFEAAESPLLRRHFELTALTKSNQAVSIEMYIADHKTDAGSIFILFVRDITDRKRAERAIQELNSRLEQRVAERTAQLEAANNELLGFTYSVSHDLRAPLRAIVSNSRIVCEEARRTLDDQTFDRLRRLESNALKMADLIENLLQFARIGQVAVTTRDVDLSVMADAIATDLMSTREGFITVQPGLVAQADPEMIKMVLFNLIENAWKYVQPGQAPRVEVGATEYGAFYVRDHGIGFDMKYADKVWEPFERLHRDCDYPGTGIGLANSMRIIVRHGGRMWTESAPGQGTTMFFELNAENAEPASARSAGVAS